MVALAAGLPTAEQLLSVTNIPGSDAMPTIKIPDTDSTYALIAFDKKGVERDDEEGLNDKMSERVLADAATKQPTNVFLFSHGWKGDVPSAVDQYNRWIGAMLKLENDMGRLGNPFRPLWIGLHWPSQPFGEETLGGNAFAAETLPQQQLMEEYIEALGDDSPKVRELIEAIFEQNRVNAGAVTMPPELAKNYRELAQTLGYKSGGLDSPPDSDGVPFDPLAAFEAAEGAGQAFGDSPIGGGLLSPLRQLSFWKMKSRARSIGEKGMHNFVARLQNALPHTRFHLMGHSFGCIVVSSILGGEGGTDPLPRTVDSLVLVQGAVSLWAYADSILKTQDTGYFRSMIRRPAVRGPVVTTRSRHDSAVGVAYPIAVGLALQIDFAAVLPPFGGIGTFGMQGMTDAQDQPMRVSTEDYSFQEGGIYNLEGSSFIAGHSAIDGPEVAHAIWQAALV